MNKWDERWINMAFLVASWSKDRSRKVGAIIVDDRNLVISLGWNGFPRGVDDNVETRHQRPAKYKYTVHAEVNCILNIKNHSSLDNCRMYVTLYPCANCANAIIQSGIKKIIALEPDWNDATYKEDFAITKELFKETKIEVEFIEKNDKYVWEEHASIKWQAAKKYPMKNLKKLPKMFISVITYIQKKISKIKKMEE